ncbi:hypothetical protein HDU87_003338 [Geranomyces variabilis]|uniref:ENTH domain-containing protein n=1 Tax=Geranomyces variabilis TaxID=109894 RepID=A0AAD5XRF1_9FUNG|nr:hypothetical protein HDU87_003338 [Geranomyces variabilis]
MERSVNKLTSKTIKPLKPKHVQILTGASWQREIPISELFRFINHRLREDHWVVVFKALITIHILMREGATDRVIGFVASNAGLLNMANFRDRTNTALGQEQSKNLRAYALYLEEKVMTYREIKTDFVRTKPDMIARLRSLEVEKGLLKEVELLQRQINALLGCTFYLEEIDNVVTLQAFRLLIGDMMALFHLLNESVIRILGEYFEMSKSDAGRALQIYKNFATQTTKTVEFFEIARRLKHALGIDVPVFKHAPVSLAGALEDYLKAPDFEAQRTAYKAKKAGKSGTAMKEEPSASSQTASSPPAATAGKNEAPLVDFFSSLDNELSAFNSPSVQNPYNAASSDPFQSLWVPDPSTNPFGAQPSSMSLQQQSNNPFVQETQALQQQTLEMNKQLQSLQANLATFNQAAAPMPNNQLAFNNGFLPPLQPQQSSYGAFMSGPQAQEAGGFTVENVFGGGGGGASGTNVFAASSAIPAIGGGFAPAPPPIQQSNNYDPFAGLGLAQAPSTQNPTLDPFGNLQSKPTISQQAHNPFAPVAAAAPSSTSASPFGQAGGGPFRAAQQGPAATGSGGGVGGGFYAQSNASMPSQPNYIATSAASPPFGAFGTPPGGVGQNRQLGGPFSTGMGGGGMGGMQSQQQQAFNPFAPVGQQPPPQQGQQNNGGALAFNPFAPVAGGPQQALHDSSLI